MLRHDAPVRVSLLMPIPSTLISLDSPGRAAAASSERPTKNNQEKPTSAITAQPLLRCRKTQSNESNLASVFVALGKFGERFGTDCRIGVPMLRLVHA